MDIPGAPVCGQIKNEFNSLLSTILSFEAKCALCFGLARYKMMVPHPFHLLVVSVDHRNNVFAMTLYLLGREHQGAGVSPK